MRFFVLASFLGLALTGCATELSSKPQSIACYDTATGVVCGPTDDVSTDPVDIDGDGQRDAFVCGDTESASDSASDSNDDSGGDGDGVSDDDGAADALSDSDDADSDSDSNADCADHDSVSDAPSDSDSTVDSADSAGDDSVSDGDSDGTADGMDCDCVPPPTDPTAPV